MELSVGHSLVAGALVGLVLGAGHVLLPRVRRLPLLPENRVESFAGGVSVTFVFLHLLPDLGRGHERFGDALDDAWRVTPLSDIALFLIALAGFVGLYGLDHLAATVGNHRRSHVFAVHLSAFAAYNAIVGYSLALYFRSDLLFGGLFTAAILVHLLLIDRTLQHHWSDRHRRVGRFALAAAVAAGALAASVWVSPPVTVLSAMWALVGGMILLNGLKDELPPAPRSSFQWFAAGVVTYAVLMSVAHAGDLPTLGEPPA